MTNCQECPFDTDTVTGYGPSSADLMFVGQAPAKYEVRRGRPFVGKSGQLLRSTLSELDLELDDYFVTNSVVCKVPFDEDTPYQVCRDRLAGEIDHIGPQIIVTLGSDAWKSVMETDIGVKSVRGRFFYSREFESVVMPTLHPAASLHDGSAHAPAFRDLYDDLEKLSGRHISGGFNFDDLNLPVTGSCYHQPDQVDETVITSPKEARDYFEFCYRKDVDYMVGDIESTGLDPRKDDLLCVGFTHQTGYAYILTPEALDAEMLNGVFDYFDMIWHNGKFDVKFLREKGIEAQIDHDTMLMSYLLDERAGVHSLEYLAGQHFNAPKWEENLKEQHLKGDMDYEDIPGRELYKYNALDVHYTLRLFYSLGEEMEEPITEAYTDVMIPGADTLADVERRGMAFDEEHLQQVKEEWSNDIDDMREQLMGYAEKYGWSTERYVEETGAASASNEINFNSNKQMWYLFYDLMNLPKWQGNRSIAEQARNWIKSTIDDEEKIEFIDLFDEYKKAKHSYSMYFKGLPKHLDDDGRIRPDLGLHRTKTGRLSSRKPNLQNIAKEKDVKNCFVAEKGNVLVEADYSQAEARVLAVFSEDAFLQEIYQNGQDLHDQVAMRIFGEDFNEKQRTLTKMINYGIMYGIGKDGLANRADIPKIEAANLIQTWKDQVPGAAEYFGEVERKVMNDEPIYTPFGRTRRFPLIKEDNKDAISREACNFPIQSVASDITLLAGVELNKHFPVVNLVHDSVVIEIEEEKLQEVAEVCFDVMPRIAEESLDADIPFEVDVEVGKRWGELEEIEEERQ